jgi:hypothetical protein
MLPTDGSLPQQIGPYISPELSNAEPTQVFYYRKSEARSRSIPLPPALDKLQPHKDRVLIAKRNSVDLVMPEKAWVLLKHEWDIRIFEPPRAPVK